MFCAKSSSMKVTLLMTWMDAGQALTPCALAAVFCILLSRSSLTSPIEVLGAYYLNWSLHPHIELFNSAGLCRTILDATKTLCCHALGCHKIVG